MRQESKNGLKIRPPGDHSVHHSGVMLEEDMAGAQDTIYLCNFRVSVDGEWLCLKELQDVEFSLQESMQRSPSPPLALSGINHHHHHHHHNDHHRQQQLPDQRELRDIMPPSPPPLQHVSSLCLYSMFLHYSLHSIFIGSYIIGNRAENFCTSQCWLNWGLLFLTSQLDEFKFWSFGCSLSLFFLLSLGLVDVVPWEIDPWGNLFRLVYYLTSLRDLDAGWC